MKLQCLQLLVCLAVVSMFVPPGAAQSADGCGCGSAIVMYAPGLHHEVMLPFEGGEMLMQMGTDSFWPTWHCECYGQPGTQDCIIWLETGVLGWFTVYEDDGSCNWHESVINPATGEPTWGCIDEYCGGDLSVHFPGQTF